MGALRFLRRLECPTILSVFLVLFLHLSPLELLMSIEAALVKILASRLQLFQVGLEVLDQLEETAMSLKLVLLLKGHLAMDATLPTSLSNQDSKCHLHLKPPL